MEQSIFLLTISCKFFGRSGHGAAITGGFSINLDCGWCGLGSAAGQAPRTASGSDCAKAVVLKPARVWDGLSVETHGGWMIVVRGRTIEAAGPAGEVKVPEGARTIELAGTTLIPGLIDAHTHVLLHPYNEATWNDQVLKEALALRVCRAVNHLRSTLLSGFTTVRDLGTEGAGYADVGLKQAVAQGIIPGPRMLVVTRAIVATGSYAPKGFAPEIDVPQGAEEADGVDSLIRVVAIRLAEEPTGSRSMPTRRWGERLFAHHSRSRSSRESSRPHVQSVFWSRLMPPRKRECAARHLRELRRSSTETAATRKYSS